MNQKYSILQGTSEDEDGGWDMAKSCYRSRDCDIDTSEDFMNSFVNVKPSKHTTHNLSDSDDNDEVQGVTKVPSFDRNHGREKPVPAKRFNVIRKPDRFEETGNDTVRYQNQFESLITDLEDDSSDVMFGSRNNRGDIKTVKDDMGVHKKESERTVSPSGSTDLSEERISTNELFGSGSIQPEEQAKGDITVDMAKMNIAKSVTERSLKAAGHGVDSIQYKDELYKSGTGKAGEIILSDELFGSGSLRSVEKEKGDAATDRPKENIVTSVTQSTFKKDTDRDDNVSNEQELLVKREEDIKIKHTTKDENSASLFESTRMKLKPDSENVGNINSEDRKINSVSSGDLFESGEKMENTNIQNSEGMGVSSPRSGNKIDIKHKGNASIRSADLFGSGHESMEFKCTKKHDHIEDANVEKITENVVANTETEADKSKTVEDQAVNPNSAASGTGAGSMPPIYQGMPYPYYPMMYPNSQEATNVTYGSYMPMMAGDQKQLNATPPGYPSSADCTNSMFQMPYQWPMQMPVQGKENGQPTYQYMPYPPFMMPPMQVDEKGKPLQNYAGMMIPHAYYMPYLPGQHPFTPNRQQSTEDKPKPSDEEYSSPVTHKSAQIEVKNQIKSTDVINHGAHDRFNSSNDTKESDYDVPKGPPRVLERQKSKSKSSLNQENARVYSFAKESIPDTVSDVRTSDVERRYSSQRKSEDLEGKIFK